MRKILILLAFALVLPNLANAQTETQRLVVWLTNGQKVFHDLSDEPETSFHDGRLWLETRKVSVSYPLNEVLRYTYEGVQDTGIEQQPTESVVIVSKDGSSVTFRQLKAGSVVNLYSANGTLLETQKSDDGQPLTLSVSHRPSGVYILKCGSQTIKLIQP